MRHYITESPQGVTTQVCVCVCVILWGLVTLLMKIKLDELGPLHEHNSGLFNTILFFYPCEDQLEVWST